MTNRIPRSTLNQETTEDASDLQNSLSQPKHLLLPHYFRWPQKTCMKLNLQTQARNLPYGLNIVTGSPLAASIPRCGHIETKKNKSNIYKKQPDPRLQNVNHSLSQNLSQQQIFNHFRPFFFKPVIKVKP